MLSVEVQLSMLINLSLADKVLAKEEKELIFKIGVSLGLTEAQIVALIENPHPIPMLKDLPPDEKFTYLFNVIQMMKIDGKVHQSEINYCERVALALGYKPGVVADLSAYIYRDPEIVTKRSYLRSIADTHLIK